MQTIIQMMNQNPLSTPTLTALQKIAARRIGIPEDFLVPIPLDTFIKQFKSPQIAALQFCFYFEYVSHLYSELENELLIIEREGLDESECQEFDELRFYRQEEEQATDPTVKAYQDTKDNFRKRDAAHHKCDSFTASLRQEFARALKQKVQLGMDWKQTSRTQEEAAEDIKQKHVFQQQLKRIQDLIYDEQIMSLKQQTIKQNQIDYVNQCSQQKEQLMSEKKKMFRIQSSRVQKKQKELQNTVLRLAEDDSIKSVAPDETNHHQQSTLLLDQSKVNNEWTYYVQQNMLSLQQKQLQSKHQEDYKDVIAQNLEKVRFKLEKEEYQYQQYRLKSERLHEVQVKMEMRKSILDQQRDFKFVQQVEKVETKQQHIKDSYQPPKLKEEKVRITGKYQQKEQLEPTRSMSAFNSVYKVIDERQILKNRLDQQTNKMKTEQQKALQVLKDTQEMIQLKEEMHAKRPGSCAYKAIQQKYLTLKMKGQ